MVGDYNTISSVRHYYVLVFADDPNFTNALIAHSVDTSVKSIYHIDVHFINRITL